MIIYTSYFGNSRKLAAANIKPICVAVGKPKFFFGPQMLDVAPTRYMIGSACSQVEYIRLYKGILSRLNAFEVVEQIKSLSEGKDVALCCYEKPSDFCHRHMLAEWITQNTSIQIKEFGVVERKEPEYKQTSLF